MLAVSTAQLAEAVSAQRRGLFRYVPEFYATTVLDMVRLAWPAWLIAGLVDGRGVARLGRGTLRAPAGSPLASLPCRTPHLHGHGRRASATCAQPGAASAAPPAPVQVHAVHRCEPPVLDHAAMLALGLRHIIDFVVGHLEDERVGEVWGGGECQCLC